MTQFAFEPPSSRMLHPAFSRIGDQTGADRGALGAPMASVWPLIEGWEAC